MNNFGRALRLAFHYKLSVIGCVTTALLVAMLWAGSLSAVFPIVDVIMTDRSIPEWVNDELHDHRSKAGDYQNRIAELEQQIAQRAETGQTATELQSELNEAKYQYGVHHQLEEKYAWLSPLAQRYLPTSPFETLLVVCVFVLAATLLKSGLRVANFLLVARLGCKVSRELREQFHAKMLALELKNFHEQGRGDLMNRCTTDLHWIHSGIRTVFGESLLEPLKMVTCLIVAATISWRLLLLTLLIAPIAGLSVHSLAKALKCAHRRAMRELSAIFETLAETMSSIKLIKAFTSEAEEQARFADSSELYYRRQMKTARYDSVISPLTESLGIVMILLTAIAGGYLVLNRQTHILGIKISDVPLTHGLMSVFFAMMAGMSDPARRLSSVITKLQQAAAASDRVYEVLDRPTELVEIAEPKPMPPVATGIRFENVNFAYTPDRAVLEGIDLDIQAGETVAIMGLNGCGKSTLLNLVPRFYDPTAGRISIDGVDLRDLRIAELRQQIGQVSQESLMRNESVAFNIAYGSPGVTQDDIERAAREAHAYDFITQKLSDGFATIVGPAGNRLSGGQRQRIALARVILRDPKILILDEATSQIDLESEQLIHQVLRTFLQDRTALLVTHRISTLTLADRIVIMENGKITSVGTHDELLEKSELYQRLTNLGYGKSA